jgi:sigma-B regulation protein RsbU (phosphoserine phosphatase)
MSSSGLTESMLGQYLALFAGTEVFIYVFMEIVSKIETIQRVIFKKAALLDYAVFVGLFGLFSVFGTLVGIPDSYGSISNIRDLAPIVAGLVAGPYVGLAVGLIGGLHRLTLGGITCLACSLSTIMAGLLAGLVYHFRKGKLLGPVWAMLFAAGIELLHGAVALALSRPYDEALEVVVDVIPEMVVAVSLGVGISVIILHDVIKTEGPESMKQG